MKIIAQFQLIVLLVGDASGQNAKKSADTNFWYAYFASFANLTAEKYLITKGGVLKLK